MKLKAILAVALTGLFTFSAVADTFKAAGKRYQGLAKSIDGNPIEFWMDVEFDDDDATVSVGKVYDFLAPYTTTATGKGVKIVTKMPGFGTPITFETTDGGETMTGYFKTQYKNQDYSFNIWMLKVPRKLKKVKFTKEEALEKVASPDGYTSFMQIKRDGNEFCITSEALFSPDGKFKFTMDTDRLREMFKTMQGSYTVGDDGEISLTLENHTYKGEIFDNGNYIKIPVGNLYSSSRNNVTLILIR